MAGTVPGTAKTGTSPLAPFKAWSLKLNLGAQIRVQVIKSDTFWPKAIGALVMYSFPFPFGPTLDGDAGDVDDAGGAGDADDLGDADDAGYARDVDDANDASNLHRHPVLCYPSNCATEVGQKDDISPSPTPTSKGKEPRGHSLIPVVGTRLYHTCSGVNQALVG